MGLSNRSGKNNRKLKRGEGSMSITTEVHKPVEKGQENN